MRYKSYDKDGPLVTVVCTLTSTLLGPIVELAFPAGCDSFAGTRAGDVFLFASLPPLHASLLSTGL